MSNIIQGRNGQKIPLAEYPPGFMDDLNRRLNDINEIDDTPEPFDHFLTLASNVLLFGAIVTALIVIGIQVGIWVTSA